MRGGQFPGLFFYVRQDDSAWWLWKTWGRALLPLVRVFGGEISSYCDHGFTQRFALFSFFPPAGWCHSGLSLEECFRRLRLSFFG